MSDANAHKQTAQIDFDLVSKDHYDDLKAEYATNAQEHIRVVGLYNELKAERDALLKDAEIHRETMKMQINVNRKVSEQLESANEVILFYAEPENWSRRESVFNECIDRSDCADYPHVTRDVRMTGGKRARLYIEGWKVK